METYRRSPLTAAMPYFLVPIQGDVQRAAGLLARAGIQHVVSRAPSAGAEVPGGHVPARSVRPAFGRERRGRLTAGSGGTEDEPLHCRRRSVGAWVQVTAEPP